MISTFLVRVRGLKTVYAGTPATLPSALESGAKYFCETSSQDWFLLVVRNGDLRALGWSLNVHKWCAMVIRSTLPLLQIAQQGCVRDIQLTGSRAQAGAIGDGASGGLYLS